jgi:aldehyde:ferredoxin oxidoreductase
MDREVFQKMREEFYQLRGWDPETGFPGAEKLHALGLSDLLEDKLGQA